MNDQETILLVITAQDCEEFKRLDAYLAAKIPDYSRNLIKKMFLEGKFTSTSKIELKKMPKPETEVVFLIPEIIDTGIEPQDIPLNILFEDEYLMVIDKPAGLVVHPAPGNPDGTLVNAILFHCKDLQGIGNENRPGIVHRLDKGTSGVMVVAKERKTHEGLVDLFSQHDIERKYEAIALGKRLPEERKMESMIGRNQNNRLKMTTKVIQGKKAITFLKTTEVFERFTHVELQLETGRTHQIRVHLAEILNAPILNDKTYGKEKEERTLMSFATRRLLKNYEHPFLHAKVLGFIHPITKEKLRFEQEPPALFQEVLQQLRSENE